MSFAFAWNSTPAEACGVHKNWSPISTCTLGKTYMNDLKLNYSSEVVIFIGATYEVACYTTQHIHNNCCRFQNFPFKCFEIVLLALHMLIPRLMMRTAQIYRIQNLNIFRFCHTAPLSHWGWFSIQYFEHIRCHAPTSRILKCLFKYVTRNWNISPSPLNIYGYASVWINPTTHDL